VDGNRTHQEPRQRPLNGFEDRGTHQASGHSPTSITPTLNIAGDVTIMTTVLFLSQNKPADKVKFFVHGLYSVVSGRIATVIFERYTAFHCPHG